MSEEQDGILKLTCVVHVQPQAIRSALDVYGKNVRKIVPINSPQIGRVMAVCIGAMMVGCISTSESHPSVVQ